MAKKQMATGYNLLQEIQGGPKKVRQHATTDHPSCSYNIPVWVDSKGNSYGQVGLPILGWNIVPDRENWGGTRPGAGRKKELAQGARIRSIIATDAEFKQAKQLIKKIREEKE